MRPIAFVVCFSLGVTLMVLSHGYQPRRATAAAPNATVEQPESAAEDTRRPRWRPRRIRQSERPFRAAARRAATVTPSEASETTLPDAAVEAVPMAAEAPTVPEEEPASLASSHPSATAMEPSTAPLLTPPAPDEAERVHWAGEPLRLSVDVAGDESYVLWWEQASGPPVTIEDPQRASTTVVNGFDAIEDPWTTTTLEFEVTIATESGRTDAIRIVKRVRATPDLDVIPGVAAEARVERRFERWSGTRLGVIEAEMARPDGRVASFVVDSATPLDFESIEAGVFEMTYFVEAGRHLYQFDVYQPVDEKETRMVLWVESSAGVPALIRLVVRW